MNISHAEIEITVRYIDRRNVPITAATTTKTGTPETVEQWLGYAKLADFLPNVRLAKTQALDKLDPYQAEGANELRP